MTKKYILIAMVILLISCKKNNEKNNIEIKDEFIQKINRMAEKNNNTAEEKDLIKLFSQTVELCDNILIDKLENLRNKAYENNNFEEIDKYVKELLPLIKVIIGGEANYISPNIEYFYNKTASGTTSNKFMKLAMSGFYMPDGTLCGGKDVFPNWLKLMTGVQGEVDKDVVVQYIKKWEQFKESGVHIYREIALSTIDELKKIGN